MDSILSTETPSGATEPLNTTTQIEASLGRVLSEKRADFAALRQMIANTPTFADHRKGLVEEAKRIGRFIWDCQAILDRRHWQDIGEEEAEG